MQEEENKTNKRKKKDKSTDIIIEGKDIIREPPTKMIVHCSTVVPLMLRFLCGIPPNKLIIFIKGVAQHLPQIQATQ